MVRASPPAPQWAFARRSSRSRPPVPNRPLLGNHQRCWVRGRHPVLGALRSGWLPYEVRLTDAADPAAADEARLICEAADIPVIPAAEPNLTKLCGGADHQGFAAKMPPFPYADAAALFDTPPALTVLADGVQDPHNLGAILRSAAEFAADAVLLPKTKAVGVTAGVAHSAAGAVGAVPIARAAVAATLRGLQAKGARVAGGDAVRRRRRAVGSGFRSDAGHAR